MAKYLIPRINYYFNRFPFALLSNRCFSDRYFENKFNNAPFYFLNKGRVSLNLILSSMDKGKIKKVGVQVFNCHTVFDAIERAGLSPVFLDINKNFTIDINDLKSKITGIDALIITHTFGKPAEINNIKSICGDLPIIEDCAHSFLSYYNKRITGSFGDASVFSFGLGKFPSVGDIGVAIINNKKHFPHINDIFTSFQSEKFTSLIKKSISKILFSILHNSIVYYYFTFPYLKKLDNKFDVNDKFTFKAYKSSKSELILLAYYMRNIELYLNSQKKFAKEIISNLKKQNVNVEYDEDINYFMLPIHHTEPDRIIKAAFKYGIELGKHFHKSINWASNFGYKNDCKYAEYLVNNYLTIPTYYNLSKQGKETILNFICDYKI